MKTLVQINVTCNGSTGRIMNQIQDEAIKQGWRAYSFYGRGNTTKENCYKIGNKLDVLFHILMTRLLDKHGHGSKIATKRLIKRIKELNPDVIQLHNLHGYYINIDILFKYLKSCNKKVVWTLHDCWSFTGHCTHFTFPKCDKWKQGCYNCIKLNEYPKSLKVDNSKKEYKIKKNLFTGIEDLNIIVPCKWLENLVKLSFLKNCHIEVIKNGIDLNVFKPNKSFDIYKMYNIPENKKIILGVTSVWTDKKGLNTFIELDKKINKDKYVIVLVGLNDKQLKNIPEEIIGIKRTENIEELASLYSRAHVFVNPTLEDTYPTTNMEAIACGTPVITYKTGGSTEMITENTGLIVDSNSIQELLTKIDLIENLKFDNSKEILNFDKDYSFKKYLEFYNKII